MTRPDANPQAAAEPAAVPPVHADAERKKEPDREGAAVGEAAAQQEEGFQQGAAVQRAADLEDRLRRALADADNLRKRTERQVADARLAERGRVASAWLPIVDNLDRALEHAGSGDPIIDGVRAVRDQAVALLSSLGYRRHDETGVAFDPQLHEAVSVAADGDAPAGTVVEVLRPGYGEGRGQLRPAAVVVAGGPG